MAIHALALQRHPMWTEIALLEHMGAHSAGLAMRHSRSMHPPAVAEQDLIGNAKPAIQRVEKRHQRLDGFTKPGGRAIGAIQHVARAEIHAMHRMSIGTQALRETGEKRCRRPLKQQKRTPHLTPTRHRNTTLNILRHQATAPPLRIRHSINSSSASSGEMSASRVRLM